MCTHPGSIKKRNASLCGILIMSNTYELVQSVENGGQRAIQQVL